MAAKILRSLAVSAFCEDMAMMLAAGIQVDDALSLMRGDSGGGCAYGYLGDRCRRCRSHDRRFERTAAYHAHAAA